MISGTYAFRFNGHANARGRPHHLIGVGVMKMRRGVLKGNYRSTIMRMEDAGGEANPAALLHASFTIKGRYMLEADGLWKATATLVSSDPPQKLECEFVFADAGNGDRLWMIASKTILVRARKPNRDVPEMVHAEAIRIS